MQALLGIYTAIHFSYSKHYSVYRFNLRINKLTNKEAMMLLMFSITGFRAHFSKSKCARVLFINACSRDGVVTEDGCVYADGEE